MDFIGTHGTNKDNVNSIKKNNFNPSKGFHHWCGKGVYFFIDGINYQPIEDLAEYWSIDNAYNKENKTYKYKEYSVIRVRFEIQDDLIFDLRNETTAKICNKIRYTLQDNILKRNKKMMDSEVWTYIQNKFNIELFLKNDYIKFGVARRKKIESRIDNCTIASLMNPSRYIDVNNIEIIKEGTTHE